MEDVKIEMLGFCAFEKSGCQTKSKKSFADAARSMEKEDLRDGFIED